MHNLLSRSWPKCACCGALVIAAHFLMTVRSAMPFERSGDAEYDVGANRCGPIALRICARFVGAGEADDKIDRAAACGKHGCSMLALTEAAEAAGLHTLVVRWRGELPAGPSPPAVIPVRMRDGRSHFVAMVAAHEGHALICDLGDIFGWVSTKRLREDMRWDGHALYVAADAADLEWVRARVGSRTASLIMRYAVVVILIWTLVLAVWYRRTSMWRAADNRDSFSSGD